MTVVLTTDTIAKRDRLDYWRDAVCASYVPLECLSDTPDDFAGTIQLHRLSKISASFVGGSQQTVRRRRRDIARATDASFLISLQIEKTGRIEQSDRSAVLAAGDFGLYSSIDRYALTLPDGFRQLVLQVPRDEMLRRLPNADLLTGIQVSGASEVGGLVTDGIRRLVRALDTANPVMLHCMQDAIVDLVATGLASVSGSAVELSDPERQILIRARAFLHANLADPDLDRTMLAGAMGLSVRRLGEIFQRDGHSIAATIREMRLRQIAADLRDPRFARQSVSEIALKWGANNLPSFSRMFQRQFDMPPTAYRAHGHPHQPLRSP
ncbi:MAG: helix-turn-helix domain-containing protein [Pseudomonadota bacterium]